MRDVASGRGTLAKDAPLKDLVWFRGGSQLLTALKTPDEFLKRYSPKNIALREQGSGL